jgi:thiaminase (transcriptional activator TenA)
LHLYSLSRILFIKPIIIYFTDWIPLSVVSRMSYSEELKHNNTDKWNKIVNHKFIIEIAEEILPISKFIFYLKQDRIFLESFCNLLAVAARITNEKQTKRWLESLIDNTTRYEMPMQHEILHQLEGDGGFTGVSAEQTTRDYISYMKRVSDSKDLYLIVSAMAPCPWTYYEISEALIKVDIRTEPFKQWIRFYSSKESRKLVNQIRQLLNKLARNADEKKKIEMKNHFSVSCNYELEFWNMAYSPID